MTKNLAANEQERVRIPAPILTILHLILAILLRNLLPLPMAVPAMIQWFGLGLAALGFVVGVLALREFQRARAAYDPKKPGSGFVTSGIYHYTRNPVYLGFVLILIGLGLSMGTYWGIVLAWPLIVFMNNLVIKPEEINLERRFKNQFLKYKASVRRWL